MVLMNAICALWVWDNWLISLFTRLLLVVLLLVVLLLVVSLLSGPNRKLTWQSDDLTSLGPCITAFSHFTTLRLLSLSCTTATLNHACGGTSGRSLFQQIMPYCDLDLIC